MNDLYGWIYKPEWLQEELHWQFYTNDVANRVSIVYGKNGSGKTTFSNAVNFYLGKPTKSSFINSTPIDLNSKEVTSIDKNRIFIFNENFINETIGFKEGSDSLNAIVMFGEAKNINDEIERITTENKTINKSIEQINVAKFKTPGSGVCLDELMSEVNDILKKHWALRDRDIKGSSRASRIPDNLIATLENTALNSDYKNEVASFNKLLNDYNVSKKYTDQLSLVSSDMIQQKLESFLNLEKLLKASIPAPMTGELEDKVLEELKKDSGGHLLKNIETIFSSEKDYCPFCFQKISSEHKTSLRKAYNTVVNKQAQEHSNSILSSIIEQIAIDFSVYKDKINNESILYELEKELNYINDSISKIDKLANAKAGNPYQSIIYTERDGFLARFSSFEKNISLLNNMIKEFNANVTNSKQLKKKLDETNILLSAYETKKTLRSYFLNKRNYEEKVNEEKILSNKLTENEQKISVLKSRAKNTEIALNEINEDLKRVFGTNQCIQLYPDKSGNYRIKSHGHPIKLSNVSVGERNAIAISYFFSLLKQNEKQGEEFSSPLFAILDDPISSFDRDNKIGVLSLIKYNVAKIIKHNSESKVLILTHDLMCVEHLKNYLNNTRFKNASQEDKKLKIQIFKINKNRQIEPLSKELSQYRLWINDIFEYAQKNPDEIDDEISRQNEMRKVLEAYFTFNYGGGFDEKLSNEEILQKIDDEQLRSYFESSIFKIGVHSGSHSETFIKLDDDGPYGYFLDDCSNDEKIRLARDLICLLFSLDDLHIISMLSKNEGEEKQIKKTINEWIKQIQTNV